MENRDRSNLPEPRRVIVGGGIGASIGILKQLVEHRYASIEAARVEVAEERADRPLGLRERAVRRVRAEARVLGTVDLTSVSISAALGGAAGAGEEALRDVFIPKDLEGSPPEDASELW